MNLNLHLPTPNSQNTNQSTNPTPLTSHTTLETDTHIDEDGNKVEIIYKKNCHIQTIRVLKGNADYDYWECKEYDESGNLIKEYTRGLDTETSSTPPSHPQKPPNPRPYKTPLDT